MLKIALYIWIAFIISAAFYARQALECARDLLGGSATSLLMWSAFPAFLLVLFTCKSHSKRERALTLLLFAVGLGYAFSFERQEETMHLVKYGILGWLLAANEFEKLGWKCLAAAALLGCTVSSFDETVQFALPYRVGDLRDVLFGVLGSAWGALIYGVSRRHHAIP
ncbi:MAG: VanZ family protein [Deltaproteobacteria bacterium]|nr:VanZ family protein [Deltaproteobacteria bacterium]